MVYCWPEVDMIIWVSGCLSVILALSILNYMPIFWPVNPRICAFCLIYSHPETVINHIFLLVFLEVSFGSPVMWLSGGTI